MDEFLGEEIQSRAQAEEIESSSRFSETENAIFANTNFLMPGPEDYSMEAVSFTFVGNCLTTLRDVPLRSFTELQRRIVAMPQSYPNGYTVFASIMDQRVDLDADMIELMSKEISQYSKRINQQEDIDEDFLLDINQLQENTMLVRENIVDKQRLISNMLRSDKYPKDLHRRFSVLLQDINSLINHTNFGFERLEYLQDTVVGLINSGPEQDHEDIHPCVRALDASDPCGELLRDERPYAADGQELDVGAAARRDAADGRAGAVPLQKEQASVK